MVIEISIEEAEAMVDRGELDDGVTCHFSSYHKGRWTYTFNSGGREYEVSGGVQTYEEAYRLRLSSESSLATLLNLPRDD